MIQQVHYNGETLWVITIQSTLGFNPGLLADLRYQGLNFLEDWGPWFGDPNTGFSATDLRDIWFRDSKQAVWFVLKWGC